MSNKTKVEETLRLLDNLKGVVTDFAAREQELEQKYRLQINRDQRQREETEAEHALSLSTARGESEAAFQAATAAATKRLERRKTIIIQAVSRDQALERINTRMGARKYHLQKRMLQAERDREASLAAEEKAFEEFTQNLGADGETLTRLEKTARESFRTYPGFVRRLARIVSKTEPSQGSDEKQLQLELHKQLEMGREQLDNFKRLPFSQLFKLLPFWFLVLLCTIAVSFYVYQHANGHVSHASPAEILADISVVALGLNLFARSRARALATRIMTALGTAHRLNEACQDWSTANHQQRQAGIRENFKTETHNIDQQLQKALAEASELRVSSRIKVDEKTVRVTGRNEMLERRKIEKVERQHHDANELMTREAELRRSAFLSASEAREAALKADYDATWVRLEADWKEQIIPICQAISALNDTADKLSPPWLPDLWRNWTPPKAFAHLVKFGRLQVDLEMLCEAIPTDKRLALPIATPLSLPLFLTYPEQGSILLERNQTGRDEMIATMNNIILRLLATAPAGKLSFTVIDPVGLGQNFAGIMHLSEYDEQLINSRIRTQPAQIEQRLADLNDHMEKVIQMYLRNDYKTIAEYNEQAGNLAEKYHFVVVADFPVNFTENAAKRLMSIAATGARCGVYTLILWDHKQPLPQDFIPAELRKGSVSITSKGEEFVLTSRFIHGTKLLLEPPPAPALANEFIHKVGQHSMDSSRVEVPFAQVAPDESEIWSLDTASEIRVPIGRTGATKLQYLAIGRGTRQHVLIAGKTGSGKSTLFHVMITNLALWCSPEQVEFYLVDFKKGVEFKCYATHHLPHARVIAIESDREFGLSVLERVDEELKRRGDLFRKQGVQDIAGYKKSGGTETIPRALLMIDEFQEFFTEEDKISQSASVLLDRIVRQGRAFGIHVVLGSQTLGGAYTLARTTIGQMVIRIALQCNEADAYLIMDDTNPAPRLLSRPGEGIYNDAAGAVVGNSPFQAVWLPDEVRDTFLDQVRLRSDHAAMPHPRPIIFEGNAPADVSENPALRNLLAAESLKRPEFPRIWLGAPNAIKGPTEAVLQRQSGNNLLVVGQRDEAVLAFVSIALVSLAAQYPLGAARFILVDATAQGSPQREYLEQIVRSIPHPVTLAKNNDLQELLKGLVEEMKGRNEEDHGADGPVTFLFIHGLQKFSRLRHEEDFSFSSDPDAEVEPSALLNALVSGGASLGFHVIATCDTYNNVNRFLTRKAISEFEMRILFQMSATDSASLIDSPKANSLGLHRALFYNEQEGSEEVFRPYALPDGEWVKSAHENLERLLK